MLSLFIMLYLFSPRATSLINSSAGKRRGRPTHASSQGPAPVLATGVSPLPAPGSGTACRRNCNGQTLSLSNSFDYWRQFVCVGTAKMAAHKWLCNYGTVYKLFLLLLLLLLVGTWWRHVNHSDSVYGCDLWDEIRWLGHAVENPVAVMLLLNFNNVSVALQLCCRCATATISSLQTRLSLKVDRSRLSCLQGFSLFTLVQSLTRFCLTCQFPPPKEVCRHLVACPPESIAVWPPLPPHGHIWDVMLVWRKGNIEKTVSVLQYCVLL